MAALINESQLNDSLEQFIWGQGFEWGYWKHPPLTSWLMWACLHFFGPSYLWTYALSATLTCLTITLTWKAAQILFDSDVANLTALLFTLHYGFTRRAQVYNHNTVLIFFVALTVLLTVLALREKKYWQWLLVGLAAALSILTKYQAAVPIMGILVAIGLSGELKKSSKGLFIATITALFAVTPHILWSAKNHFETVTYAMHYVDDSEFSLRLNSPGAFFVNQLKFYLPTIFFGLALWAVKVVNREETRNPLAQVNQIQRAWLIGLIGFPLVFIVFIALALGVRLQSQWGLQTSQFLPILIAFYLFRYFGGWSIRHFRIWLLIQFIAIAIFIGQGTGIFMYASRGSAVRELPAQKISDSAMAFWKSKTNCPLKYLSGHPPMSAMISAYSHQLIQVLEDGDFEKSPWIDKKKMNESGFLDVMVAREPSNDSNDFSMKFEIKSYRNNDDSVNDHLILKFHKPLIECGMMLKN